MAWSLEQKRAYHREYNKKRRQADTDFAQRERDASLKWKAKNKEAVREYARTWHLENSDTRRGYNQEWRENNPDYAAEWRSKNAGRCRSRLAAYRARKISATPPWADHNAIRHIYDEAARLTRETGIPHEVDHIVPLFGKTVCGLHVEGNLQVLTAQENRKKGSKFYG